MEYGAAGRNQTIDASKTNGSNARKNHFILNSLTHCSKSTETCLRVLCMRSQDEE